VAEAIAAVLAAMEVPFDWLKDAASKSIDPAVSGGGDWRGGVLAVCDGASDGQWLGKVAVCGDAASHS
jgi:hypothetical protein